MTAADWQERETQWKRFHAWENRRLRAEVRELRADLDWMWAAWELARLNHPRWLLDADDENRRRHAVRRAALARIVHDG